MSNSIHFFCPAIGAETVQVKQGEVSGMIKGSDFGSVYKAYLGIPYAAPPIGELRFKDPEPPACWKGVRLSMDMCDKMSAQLDLLANVIGSEDCLYLNVYVPYSWNKERTQKPVMVWIHGGNFLHGNGNIEETRPDYFMDKDVVMVSINYRLGVLGFLNLEHEEAHGNQGLKDQVAALKWIRENIASFEGDPDNITVFGCGAGAISTHLLMLSPLSEGLFHKAILQSGVALCQWAVREQQPEAFKLALLLGCDSRDPREVAKFLRECPYKTLVQMENSIINEDEIRMKKVTFGPTVDKESENPFLPASPMELIHRGNNIPILLGYTSHEYLKFIPDSSEEALEKIYANLQLYLANNLDPVFNAFELGGIAAGGNTTDAIEFNQSKDLIYIVHYLSEIYYNIPIRAVASIRSSQNSAATYFYLFDYVGKEGKLFTISDENLQAVAHMDELAYLFYKPIFKSHSAASPAPDSLDYNMINLLTTKWSNFAKLGRPYYEHKHPIANWSPISKDTLLCCPFSRYYNVLTKLANENKKSMHGKLSSVKNNM